MRVVDGLVVDPASLDLHRALGYGSGVDVKPEIRERIDRLVIESRTLLRPRGIYVVEPAVDMPESIPLGPCCLAGVAVCTIGAELEEEGTRRFEKGDLLDGFVLDAIGSEAAEETANLLDELIAHDPRAAGYHPGRRISPGYGKFSLSAQKDIFSLLPADRVGVSLTDSLMMVPRKSISFAVPFGIDPDGDRDLPQCAHCGLEHCPYRRSECQSRKSTLAREGERAPSFSFTGTFSGGPWIPSARTSHRVQRRVSG